MEPHEEGALIPGSGWGAFSLLSFHFLDSDFVLAHIAFALCLLGGSLFSFLLSDTTLACSTTAGAQLGLVYSSGMFCSGSRKWLVLLLCLRLRGMHHGGEGSGAVFVRQ